MRDEGYKTFLELDGSGNVAVSLVLNTHMLFCTNITANRKENMLQVFVLTTLLYNLTEEAYGILRRTLQHTEWMQHCGISV